MGKNIVICSDGTGNTVTSGVKSSPGGYGLRWEPHLGAAAAVARPSRTLGGITARVTRAEE